MSGSKKRYTRIVSLSTATVLLFSVIFVLFSSWGFAAESPVSEIGEIGSFDVTATPPGIEPIEPKVPIAPPNPPALIAPSAATSPILSTDKLMYFAIVQTGRSYWSAPSTSSTNKGPIPAGTVVAYYKWDADETWVYRYIGGECLYFKANNLTKLPANTSTDKKVKAGVTLTDRTFWWGPSIQSKNMGKLPKGSYVTYYEWTDDGSWMWTTNGYGQVVYFMGANMAQVPMKSSKDSKAYTGVVLTERSFWSAPSTLAVNRGPLTAKTVLSYYYWTEDGSWLYRGDGKGGLLFFKGANIVKVPQKNSTDNTVYMSKVKSDRNYWSGPTTYSRILGWLPTGSIVSYKKWTEDGSWMYRTDGYGRTLFFRGGELEKYVPPAPQYFGTYVDVNLSTQKLMYIENGYVKLTSDVVTGAPGMNTPAGTFYILYKQSPAYLMGNAYVNYWMPFTSVGHGLHDASWQPWFGGDRWTYAGSHGCVNMPFWAAQQLYWSVSAGTRVYIHW